MFTALMSTEGLLRRKKKISSRMDTYALQMVSVVCDICGGGDTTALRIAEQRLRTKMSGCSASLNRINKRLEALHRAG